MTVEGAEKVYLGQDTVLETSDYGDKGTDSTGFQAKEISDMDADYSVNEDDTYAEVGNHSGDGSLTAWAYLGYDIKIADDSGQQDATVTFRGDILGSMNLDNANNYVRAKLMVEDQNDDEIYDSTIYEKIDYVGSVNESLTESIVVPFEAQHYYGFKMELLTEITVTESGDWAISDFHVDGSSGGYLYWDQIEINF